MSLDLPKTATTWWARIRVPSTGKRVPFNLGVPVEGVRPSSLKLKGDEAFERSRQNALEAEKKIVLEVASPALAIEKRDRVVELARGEKKDLVRLEDLEEIWKTTASIKSRRLPKQSTQRNAASYFASFIDYMDECHRGVVDHRLVTAKMATGWVQWLQQKNYPVVTIEKYVATLRAAFNRANRRSGWTENPFRELALPEPDSTVAHREPFARQEMDRILTAAEQEPVIGGAVVTMANSGMRRHDAACLKWRDVSLAEGWIKVRAGKTSTEIEFPIFPRLRRVLETARKTSGSHEYVFPDAAAIFTADKDNRNAFLLRFRTILKAAGIDYDERNAARKVHGKRLRRASISGPHALKTTFVTLALDAGIPIEMLQKIVGNKAVEIVMQNYYKPSREVVRERFGDKMPREITGVATPEKSVLEMLQSMTSETWEATRDLLVKRISSAP